MISGRYAALTSESWFAPPFFSDIVCCFQRRHSPKRLSLLPAFILVGFDMQEYNGAISSRKYSSGSAGLLLMIIVTVLLLFYADQRRGHTPSKEKETAVITLDHARMIKNAAIKFIFQAPCLLLLKTLTQTTRLPNTL